MFRPCLATLALLVLFTVTTPALAAGSIAIVGETSSGDAELLRDAGVEVLRDLGTAIVVRADERPAALPSRLAWQTLALADESAPLYSVGFRTVAQLESFAASHPLLWSEGRSAVFAGDDAVAGVAGSNGGEVARIFMRPTRSMRAAPAAFDLPAKRQGDPDPVIEEIVAAVSFMRLQADVQRLQDFQTRYAAHDSCWAAAQWIASEFTAAGIDSVYFHEFHPTYHDNVVAVIPGVSQPEKTVVIGGHYDSLTSNHNFCPGADDDASGTACVIECARVLADHQFDYTIKLVAFGGEELGLYGSEGFADDAAAAGEDIVAAIAVDMIGYLAPGDTRDLDIIDNAASQWIRDLAGTLATTYVPALPVVDGSLPGGAGSDHQSFWNAGYHAILFFEDTGNYSPYIHTANDVVGTSFNDPVLEQESTRLGAALVAALARPFRLSIAHEPLANTEAAGPYAVEATILAAGELDPGSLTLYYDSGSGWQTAPLQSQGGDTYAGEIPPLADGTLAAYYLEASDLDGYTARHPDAAPDAVHRFFVGPITTLLTDAFETDDGWTVSLEGDASTGQWVRADPVGTFEGPTMVQPEDDHTPDPGTICWVTGNTSPGAPQGDNDVDGGDTIVLSRLYDLSTHEHAWVRYFRWYTNDTGSSPGSDEWVVQVTADGVQWVDVERTSQTDRSWREVEVYLPGLITLSDQVRFRFIAADEGSGSIVEAAVDDFELRIFEGATPAPETPPVAGLAVEAVYPNPFNPRVVIRFRVDGPTAPATVAVYDMAGRRVATLLHEVPTAGSREVVWDGRDASGRAVAAGGYLCRIDAGGHRAQRKLMLVR